MPLPSRWLPFEKPLQDVEEQIQQLEAYADAHGIDVAEKIERLRAQNDELCGEIFSNLCPWDNALMARHPNRPHTVDYLRLLIEDFVELHGDRRFGDDPAVIAGFGSLAGRTIAIVGHEKGRDVKERQFRNFGYAKPEGYRKAVRVMQLAERRGIPIVTLVDTPAAEARLEAEERGISEAIASSMAAMSGLKVPIIVVIIGEGGSGGAIGIAVGDHVAMLEHAIYSVIPPEGCAAILDTFGRDGSRANEAAAALKLTAEDNLRLGIIDEIIPEPVGGAHRRPAQTAERIREAILRALATLEALPVEELVERRYQKFREIGAKV